MPVPTRSAADPFVQLDRSWARHVGRRRHAATVHGWAAQSPALFDVTHLDDFVTDDRDRRRRYLGAVVELVRAGDELAGEVLVQMLVPGLVCLTSEMAAMFPRVDRYDLASDVVSVAWAQVNALASGRSAARTAGCILRNVRRDTIRWQRSLRPGEARGDAHSVVSGDGSDDGASVENRSRGRARLGAVDISGGTEAMFDQCETRLVLAEAARAGVIDERLAALLWHVVADDRQFKQAATDVGLSEPWAYQLRARTIPALRAHLADAA